MLSRYTDFQRLGQGGMGVVYRATDTQLHRPVALKFVTARFGSEDQARARFLREARMAAALNHPAICTIHEIGEVQPGDERLVAPDAPFPTGTPFIAMELIEGKALDALLRDRGRFAPAELLDIAIPIAEALAAAHAKGIVHRDLKPANVMVSPEGRPKILDFGLAKIVETAGDEAGTSAETGSAELTRQGQVLGTVAYMSPEQAQGKPVDLRSDIFSFGVMLYELAAGERPFRGDTPTSTLAKILETEPKPLGDIRSDLPGELLRIVRRCLRKRPEERVQSTGDLVVALKDLQQERASGTTRGWSDAPPAALQRGRRALALSASALILVAAFAAGAVALTRRHLAPKTEPALKQLTSNPPETALNCAVISPDGTYLAFADPTGTYLRVIRTGETTRILAAQTLDVLAISWFPDGTRLVVTALTPDRQGESAWTVSVLGGPARKLRDDALVSSISPDGSQLLFYSFKKNSPGNQDGVWVMGPDGEDARSVLPQPEGSNSYLAVSWSPDGKRLLFLRRTGSAGARSALLGISDLTGSPPTVLLSDPSLLLAACVGSCAWLAPDRILYTRNEPPPNEASANLWELRIDPTTSAAIGAPKRLTALADTCVSGVNATADGRQVGFLKQRRQWDVYLGELQGRGSRLENVRRLTLDDRSDFASDWTRDSRMIYFASDRHGTFDVFRQSIEGGAAEAVVQGLGNEQLPRLSPDGSFLFYLDERPGLESAPVRVMRVPVDGGAPEVVVETNASAVLFCPKSSAASCVLSESRDKKPTFYPLDAQRGKGREIGRISRAVHASSLSPDGTQIAFIGGAPESGAEDMKLRSMRVSDGAIHDLDVPDVALPQDLAWSPDGRSMFIIELVAKGASPGWRVVHADLAGHVNVLKSSNLIWQWLSNPLPSPDGRYLAFGLLEFQSNAWSLENF